MPVRLAEEQVAAAFCRAVKIPPPAEVDHSVAACLLLSFSLPVGIWTWLWTSGSIGGEAFGKQMLFVRKLLVGAFLPLSISGLLLKGGLCSSLGPWQFFLAGGTVYISGGFSPGVCSFIVSTSGPTAVFHLRSVPWL